MGPEKRSFACAIVHWASRGPLGPIVSLARLPTKIMYDFLAKFGVLHHRVLSKPIYDRDVLSRKSVAALPQIFDCAWAFPIMSNL
jgi:hypothetical protein